MNFLQKNAKYVAAVAGVAGAALRAWTLCVGVDEKNLYPAHHAGWTAYLLLCVVMTALFLLLGRKQPASDEREAPAAVVVGVHAVCAALLFWYAFSAVLGTGVYARIVGVVGVLSALALLLAGIAPLLWREKKLPLYLGYALPCVYFLMEMLRYIMDFRGEPELVRYGAQVLAMLSASLASYQLWGRAVGLDSAKARRFWQCMAIFLCLAATPGTHPVFLALAALFLL